MPHCRGVWLDRGELDKILERAALRMPPTVHTPARGYPERDEHYRKRKNRMSFLEELFDFDWGYAEPPACPAQVPQPTIQVYRCSDVVVSRGQEESAGW
ncbi:MAG: TFIIB-type zinc ribbon-containing protein [Armatimonadota bacterium]